MKFSTVSPATLATLATQGNALFSKNAGYSPATLATLATQKGVRQTRVAEVAEVATPSFEKLKFQEAGDVVESQKPQKSQQVYRENSNFQEVPTGQGGPETPQFMTREELDFLHCHEPDFLRKVRHAFIQQRLADYSDHYREWFIDELTDSYYTIISIGSRGIGTVDILIAKPVYDRARVLACLSHFSDGKPYGNQQDTVDCYKIVDPMYKRTLLGMAGSPVYELRKPLPVATPATSATQALGIENSQSNGIATPATPATPATRACEIENSQSKEVATPATPATLDRPEDKKVAKVASHEPAFALRSITVDSGDSAGNTLAQLGYRVRYLRDPETAKRALAEVLNAGHRLLGLDIETSPTPAYATHLKAGLDPWRADIRLSQVATYDGTVLVFDHQPIPVTLLEPLMQHHWTAHNAGFEWRFLKAAGLQPGTPHCTLLMSRVATGQPLRLADASKQALDIKVDKTLQVSNWKHAELSPTQINYAALDAVLTLKLAKQFADPINSTRQQAAYRVFQEAIPVVAQQMLNGVPFDQDGHRQQMTGWLAELVPLQEELRKLFGGINPDSGQQMAQWLRQNLEPSVLAHWPTTETGQLKTDMDAFLGAPDLPLIQPLKQYKLLRKRLSTYGDGYARFIHPITGRIHADFQIAGARSGRFRCSNPNLQNPPRDSAFRSLFSAPECYRLVVADYSQVELRIAALIAQEDKTMLDAYQLGQDLHRKTAAAVAGIVMEEVTKAQRQMAKAVNFGLIYGMGAAGLAAYASSSYGVNMTLEEATAARDTFFRTYPGIKLWHVRTQARGRVNPIVCTQSGLIRDFGQEKGFKLTEALNTPVQGSGAECLLRSLVLLPKHLAGLDAKLIHHVHDEIILEVAERDVSAAKQALSEAMTAGFLEVFPGAQVRDLVEAHDGKTWAAAK